MGTIKGLFPKFDNFDILKVLSLFSYSVPQRTRMQFKTIGRWIFTADCVQHIFSFRYCLLR